LYQVYLSLHIGPVPCYLAIFVWMSDWSRHRNSDWFRFFVHPPACYGHCPTVT
jgi:hypothetical protein